MYLENMCTRNWNTSVHFCFYMLLTEKTGRDRRSHWYS